MMTLAIADEQTMTTAPVTPMEEEMRVELVRGHGIPSDLIQFRQRVSAYHLRFSWWRQLPEKAYASLQRIAQQHGYKCQETVINDDDRFNRWSYDLKKAIA